MSARPAPKPAPRLPGPPLQFAVVVAGMCLRYTKLPDARARGWLS